MAVSTHDTEPVARASSGRRLLIGTNVLLATALALGVVVISQVIAFNMPVRYDMTSSGVNSLSDGTENLLGTLESNVRLTSLYFETDREEQDQPRYRRAVEDLLNLYEANNRSKVSMEWINPLKDHERFRKLKMRLAEKTSFRDQIAPYSEALERYTSEFDDRIREQLQGEITKIRAIATGGMTGSDEASVVAPIENLLLRRLDRVEAVRERIDDLIVTDVPQHSAAIGELRALYREVSKTFTDIGKYGQQQLQRKPALSPDESAYLSGSNARFVDLVAAIEEQTTKLQELEPLKIDDLMIELAPTANAILVETDDDARVVNFGSIWPPMQQGAPRAAFSGRAFKGEEKLTSAILRATHKEQTAVIFVRYGGGPLFLGGFMPGQPPAPYAAMKIQLEDANFIVQEWDVKTRDTMPEIDPAPTKTIFVLLKPTAPSQGPMGQPGREPPFDQRHRQMVMKAMGENVRAIFAAGWYQGPFGAIPATYEYNDYLTKNWGITVDTSAMLIETTSNVPGQYVVGRRDFYNMQRLEVGEHMIVGSPLARQLTLPWCAPLQVDKTTPEGVTHHTLVVVPTRDGLWGVKNIQAYQRQLERRPYLTKEEGDLVGPFELAVAAEKENQKIVVISARDFATDQVAFARQLVMAPSGFQIRSVNPGNVTLLVNSLHWLNDRSDFMDIGKPIDAAVLEIADDSTVKAVQALTIFVWPALVMMAGGMVWWVRRR